LKINITEHQRLPQSFRASDANVTTTPYSITAKETGNAKILLVVQKVMTFLEFEISNKLNEMDVFFIHPMKLI
jgi:hypothetical protein